jgi:hypothetical protein
MKPQRWKQWQPHATRSHKNESHERKMQQGVANKKVIPQKEVAKQKWSHKKKPLENL